METGGEQVLHHTEMAITCEDDVALVRRKVRGVAQARGFDAFACAAVTTAASEISRNVLVHAKSGDVVIEEINDRGRVGIRMVFRDNGPGIPDLERAMSGGFSTARSLGLGLSGSRRLVDEFDIDTKVGHGTRITMIKWIRF